MSIGLADEERRPAPVRRSLARGLARWAFVLLLCPAAALAQPREAGVQDEPPGPPPPERAPLEQELGGRRAVRGCPVGDDCRPPHERLRDFEVEAFPPAGSDPWIDGGDLVDTTMAGVAPNLQAVLLGGAAGSFVTPEELDLRLTIEDAREKGTTLGSGVVLAIDDGVDLRRLLIVIAAFFRDESCGQCVPCRVGTVRQEEALARLLSGRTRGSVQDELALIAEIGEAMRDASICGLGQTAANAIASAVQRLGVFAEAGA